MSQCARGCVERQCECRNESLGLSSLRSHALFMQMYLTFLLFVTSKMCYVLFVSVGFTAKIFLTNYQYFVWKELCGLDGILLKPHMFFI